MIFFVNDRILYQSTGEYAKLFCSKHSSLMRKHSESSQDIDRSFQTTHWSLVAGVGQAETRQRSLKLLCERY